MLLDLKKTPNPQKNPSTSPPPPNPQEKTTKPPQKPEFCAAFWECFETGIQVSQKMSGIQVPYPVPAAVAQVLVKPCQQIAEQAPVRTEKPKPPPSKTLPTL